MRDRVKDNYERSIYNRDARILELEQQLAQAREREERLVQRFRETLLHSWINLHAVHHSDDEASYREWVEHIVLATLNPEAPHDPAD